MYETYVDRVRKAVAVAFGACGLGYAIAANMRDDGAMTMWGIAIVLSLVAAFGLFIEFLVRARLEAQSRRATAYQFTLAELMFSIVAVAVMLGIFRILGWWTIGLVIVSVLLLACSLEAWRSRSHSEKPESATNHRELER